MSDTRDTSGRSRDEWSGATDAHGADGRAERLDPHGPDGQGGGSREGTRRPESSWTSSSTYRHPGEAPVMHSRPTGPTYAGYDRTAAADRPTTSFPAAPGGYGTGGPGGPGARDEDPYGLTAAGSPRSSAVATRRGPSWVGVIAIALVAALLASLLTWGLVSRTATGTAPATSGPDRGGEQAPPVVTSTTTEPDWANIADAVGESVVAINVRTGQGGGQGSGIVYDEQAHVVTNNHVVEGAVDGGVNVTMADGEIIGARVIGSDVATDLAVLELDKAPQTLQPATFGNSDEVVVGDPVAAIGNPLGLSSTMTTGIVSALDRPVLAQDPNNARATSPVVTNAIQVDASVNPGNSGGALFDGAGRVIGVTSSIATTSATSGSVGLGFAIPANLAQRVVPQLIENGRAEHAYLGVSMNDGTATADGVTRTGANVLRVESGTPAAEAGLRAGDVIVAMDDKAIGGADALTGYVRGHSTGDQVRLTFVRGGSQQQVDVTLTTRPDNL